MRSNCDELKLNIDILSTKIPPFIDGSDLVEWRELSKIIISLRGLISDKFLPHYIINDHCVRIQYLFENININSHNGLIKSVWIYFELIITDIIKYAEDNELFETAYNVNTMWSMLNSI